MFPDLLPSCRAQKGGCLSVRLASAKITPGVGIAGNEESINPKTKYKMHSFGTKLPTSGSSFRAAGSVQSRERTGTAEQCCNQTCYRHSGMNYAHYAVSTCMEF